jgi:putative spermidine/putrescine transport system ATP-binding protein
VLTGAAGLIAVRADRCRLAPQGEAGIAAQVVAVEYPGTVVRMAVKTASGEEASVVLPDQVYYAAPVQPGSGTRLTWSSADEHALAA